MSRIERISSDDIDWYVAQHPDMGRYSFFQSYSNEGGGLFPPSVVLNYIIDRYNTAIRECHDYIDFSSSIFTDLSYDRMCRYMIPLLQDLRGVKIRKSDRKLRVWEIVLITEDRLNEKEWPRLPLAQSVPTPSLRIKE